MRYKILSILLTVIVMNSCNSESNVDRINTLFLYGKSSIETIGDASMQNGNFIDFKSSSSMVWQKELSVSDEYDIYLIADAQSKIKDLQISFYCNEEDHKFNLTKTKGPWSGEGKNFERKLVLSSIPLQKGKYTFTITIPNTESDEVVLSFRSLQLVPHSSKEAIKRDNTRALAARASTKWLNDVGYGLMFHWTSQSVNSDGTNTTFEQAVDNFDVDKFTQMVKETGAGYVMFTIGHAEQYCPAPIESWEKCHPGKTTKRDLIMEMTDALEEIDVKLICYMHSLGTAKLGEGTNEEFDKRFTSILTEFGQRYGEKLAGYWFDCWYQIYEFYPEISFEEVYNTTKIGNKDRIICLNSWVYPSVSPWQDYWAGEVASPVALPVNGSYLDGPAVGLNHQTLLIMEPYWVQEKAEMPTPRFTSEQLANYIDDCMKNGGAVTINLGIYQNGEVGKDALEVMRGVKQIIRGNQN